MRTGLLIFALTLAAARPTESAAGREAAPVKIGVIDHSQAGALLLLAQKYGYFKDAGVAAEIVRIRGRGGRKLQILLNGNVDMIDSGLYMNMLEAAWKEGARITAEVSHELPGKPTRNRWLVRKDLAGRVRTWADLKGLTVAPPDPQSARYIPFTRGLERAGLRPGDLRLMPGLDKTTAFAMFINRQLDVANLREPYGSQLVHKGEAEYFAGSDVAREFAHSNFLFYSRRLREEDPEAGLGVMLAYLRAVRRVSRMPQAGRKALLEKLWKVRIADAEAVLLAYPDGHANAAWLLEVQEYARQRGFVRPGFELADLVDPSFAREASKLLDAEKAPAGKAKQRRRR